MKNMIENSHVPDFNWDLYENGFRGGNQLKPNKSIKNIQEGDVVYSTESYAQEFYNLICNGPITTRKDVNVGDKLSIVDISNVNESTFDIIFNTGLVSSVDYKKERKFIEMLGFDNITEFKESLKRDDIKEQILNYNLSAKVMDNRKSNKVSLYESHLDDIRNELFEQITNPTSAYTCKVTEINTGGFICDINGVKCFMPGSLAAVNKIADFQSYLGKEITVMVENYLPDIKTFVISHKKYIKYIMPNKIKELKENSLTTELVGTVTGSSKYGIFIEFNELFTGLMHVSKMVSETSGVKESFLNRTITPGTEVKFYIDEISDDNRIILSEEHPSIKLEKINKFVHETGNDVISVKVINVQKDAIRVSTTDGIVGIIKPKEFRKNNIDTRTVKNNDAVKVKIDYCDDKIYFKLVL